ncbi:hypothetical protein [Streptomyces sp. NPDC057250]|uniref:hypothetical protein n=1 Tax=Streptomyces sp. NPDC057250 TaxID=3346068 RepID=UPI0036254D56
MAQRVPDEYLNVWTSGPVTQYPWHLWTDGSTWQVQEGVDFDATPAMFISAAQTHADLMNLEVKSALVPSTWQVAEGGRIVLFRFYKPEDEDE